jgi:SAM-dependent methyltransferase
MIFDYRGDLYPDYLKNGNACAHIAPAAAHFCRGKGLDIGGGKWPLPGAIVIDEANGGDAMQLPEKKFAYVFSSHCLEHLVNPIAALEHWKSRIEPGGVIFLYLPHPSQKYWRPQWNRKHLHSWRPEDMAQLLRDLGFINVIHSERDLFWSFAVVGFKPGSIDSPALDPMDRFKLLVENADEYFRDDPQMLSVFKTFGAEAFRRSSMFDGLEDFIKAQNFRGKHCVEIGTYSGITAIILSRYFEQVTSIDIFPHTAKHTIIKHLGITNIRFVDVKDNEEKAKVIEGLTFDGAYQDGDHVKDAESDFALLRRCGQVLFHEYYEQQPEVWKLVNALRLTGEVTTDGKKLALWRAR